MASTASGSGVAVGGPAPGSCQEYSCGLGFRRGTRVVNECLT